MHTILLRCSLAALLSPAVACAADQLAITVSHDLDIARPSETIAIPWAEVNRALPGALIQRIVVKNSKGQVLAHQVTNVAPQAKDPEKVGLAYGELLFQHDFSAGEKSAVFTVEKSASLAPVFPARVFARYVPERLDDFAWENDRIGHRTYGPALAAPAPPGGAKEVLVTSGLDVWFKRVDYPIVDRWYNKGHSHYHHDDGEGMDMYNVGKSRGCGGVGIWDGKTLFVSSNYTSWKVLANGPVRAVFELSYDSWDANGTKVSEVKRFTVDAGHQLDRIDSRFSFAGPRRITVAVGLNKTPADKSQDAKIAVTDNTHDASTLQWVELASQGAFGTAIIVPSSTGTAEDALNHLRLAEVESGQPLRYYAGAAWDRAGKITTREAWTAYVAAAAARLRNPVRIRLAAR